MARQNTDLGFSVIEVLLILVVVGVFGFAGWYVYHAKQASDKNYSSANNSSTLSYKNKPATTSEQTKTGQSDSSDQSTTQATPVPVDGLSIKVIDSYRYYTTKYPDNTYVVVDVSLTNTTTSSLQVPVNSFSLVDSAHDTSSGFGDLAGTTMSNGQTVFGDQTLSAGQTATGALTFSTINQNYSLYTLSYKNQTFPVDASAKVTQQ